MEPKSRSTILRYIKLYRSFHDLVFEAANEWQDRIGQKRVPLHEITDIETGNYHPHKEVICLRGEESHCSCCGPDTYYLELPIKFLYDPDGAFEDWDRTEGEKRRQAEAAKREREEAVARQEEIRERLLLVRLKQKYEGTDGNSTG